MEFKFYEMDLRVESIHQFMILVTAGLKLNFVFFSGNYSEFVNTMTERLKSQQREYDAQVEYRKHVQEFIDKFRFNAKRASLVQSRIKQLEKL